MTSTTCHLLLCGWIHNDQLLRQVPSLVFYVQVACKLGHAFAYCVHLRLGEEKLGVVKDESLAC